MPVGDVDSNEKGSAARYNDGKPELAQIPMVKWMRRAQCRDSLDTGWVVEVLNHWHCYQCTGNHRHLMEAFEAVPVSRLRLAADVLTYGADKYAQWNWTKGQSWSVPFNSGLRHLAAWLDHEDFDPESGLSHLGHFICNVLFLSQYSLAYQEGEDWVVYKALENIECAS